MILRGLIQKFKINVMRLGYFGLLTYITCSQLYAQDGIIKVNGVIVNGATKSEPISGAYITEKNSDKGTTSDIDGKYELEVGENSVLLISIIGYEDQEISVKGRSIIDIKLSPSSETLEEAIVVGYGTQKRKDIMGAIANEKIKDVSTRPHGDIANSLQGKIPGLNITHADGGDPSKSPGLNIRGFNSINGGSPLVLIDGIEGAIDDINPNDVESVSVLKDAESAAIYGARGAFGVVLIETKKGEEGDIVVEYENNFGWSKNTTRTDFITDPYEYGQIIDKAIGAYNGATYTNYNDNDWTIIKEVADGKREPFHEEQPDGTNKFYYKTNFYKEFFKTTRPMEMHNINITGGSKKLNARLSGRVYERQKIQNIQNANMNRYNLKMNVNFNPTDWLTISGDIRFMKKFDEEYSGTRNGWTGVYGVSKWRDSFPFHPAFIDGVGVSVGRTGDGYGGRLAVLDEGNTYRKYYIYNLNNTLRAKLTPFKGFEFNVDYTYRFNRDERIYRYAPFEYLKGDRLDLVTEGLDRSGEFRWSETYDAFNAFGSYEKNITNGHYFKLMAGYNQETFFKSKLGGQREGFPVRELYDLELGSDIYDAQGGIDNWAIQGFYGRFNYDYKDKYLLEVTARYDGSSRFPKNDRWGFFPSGAIAWRIDKEEFWKPIKDVVSSSKLRASYGKLGNQNVGLGEFEKTLGSGQTTSWLDGNGNKLYYASAPSPLPAQIGWESVETKNLGLDFGLFKETLSGSLDLYEKRTMDMYLPGEPLPSIFGAYEPKRSYAAIRNRGWELAINYSSSFNIAGDPFSLNVGANVSNNIGVVTKFDNPDKILSQPYEGQRLGEIWGYNVEGQFQSDEAASKFENQFENPSKDLQTVYNSIFHYTSTDEWSHLKAGDLKYEDSNGDGKIDDGRNTLKDPGDQQPIGNTQPRFPFGFFIDAQWKGFDFSISGQGVGKQDWMPSGPIYWGTFHRPYVTLLRKDLYDEVWTEDNPGRLPQVERAYQGLGDGRSLYENNNYTMENIGYLRIKNLTVGYVIPKHITERAHIKKLRVYFSGENIFTWSFGGLTKYIDPEEMSAAPSLSNPNSANSRPNKDTQKYPMTKTYSIGFQLTL